MPRPGSLRCTMCDERYPIKPEFLNCPDCGIPTGRYYRDPTVEPDVDGTLRPTLNPDTHKEWTMDSSVSGARGRGHMDPENNRAPATDLASATDLEALFELPAFER